MARLYSTGPAHIYVSDSVQAAGFVTSITLGGIGVNYLGTAKFNPIIDLQPAYSPIYSSLTGRQVPFDQTFDAEQAVVVAELTRWSEKVYAKIASRPFQSSSRGDWDETDAGTIMGMEGAAHVLFIQFPYSKIIDNLGDHVPAGYMFPTSYLTADHMDPLGNTYRGLTLTWACMPNWDDAEQSFTTYSIEVPQLPQPT